MTRKKVISALQALCLLLCFALLPVQEVSAAPTVKTFYVTCVSGKSTYYEGETFSAEGYEGTVIYSDNTQKTLGAGELKWNAPEVLSSSASVEFSCSLTDIKYSFPIKVVKLTGLSASGTYKKDYLAGEDCFDPAGMKLTLEYEDKTTVVTSFTQNSGAIVTRTGSSSLTPVASDFVFTPSDGEVLTSSATALNVSYTVGTHTLTASGALNVKKVESLEIRKSPSDVYPEGSVLSVDSSSLSVYAKFSGESTAVRVFNYEILNGSDPVCSNEEGRMTYTVALDGVTAQFEIDVIQLDHLTAVSSGGIQNIYLHGTQNSFDPEKIQVIAYYTDLTSADVTDSVVFTYPSVFRAGDKVSASYAGMEIDLSDAVKVHSAALSVLKTPDKTEYSEGGNFSFTGLLVSVEYDDGEIYVPAESELQVKSGATCISFAEYSSKALECSDWNAVIDWNGAEAVIEYKVLPKENISIEIVKDPDTVKYVAGQAFDPAGMEVKVTRGSSVAILSSAQVEVIPSSGMPLTVSDTEVTVRYYLSPSVYYETSLPIEVTAKTISNIYVSKNPTKTLYNEGDTLVTSGMELTIVYNDRSTSTVRSGYTLSQSTLILKTGGTSAQSVSVEINYGGKSCVLAGISVTPKAIDRIAVTAQPKKTSYNVGEAFDPSGMTVSLYFKDSPNKEYVLDSSYYSVYPVDGLSAGTSYVTVSFRGISTKCGITVKGGTVTTQPAVTTQPEVTTEVPVTQPVQSTEITTAPEVPTEPATETASPETQSRQTDVTETEEVTGDGTGTILVLWIVVIIIIAVAIIGLIIYYKKNFT